MALNDYVQLSELGVTDFNANTGPGDGSSLATGDLRRKYNFGDRVSELAIAQDPFFRFVSKVSKKPTDDPSFKFTEKRGSYHKRYAYVGAVKNNSGTWVTTSDLGGANAVGATIYVRMITDYKNSGNIQNVYGNTANEIKIGASGTMPKFFLQDQLIKIPCATSAAGDVADYMVVKVAASPTEHAFAGAGSDATAPGTGSGGAAGDGKNPLLTDPTFTIPSDYGAGGGSPGRYFAGGGGSGGPQGSGAAGHGAGAQNTNGSTNMGGGGGGYQYGSNSNGGNGGSGLVIVYLPS